MGDDKKLTKNQAIDVTIKGVTYPGLYIRKSKDIFHMVKIFRLEEWETRIVTMEDITE